MVMVGCSLLRSLASDVYTSLLQMSVKLIALLLLLCVCAEGKTLRLFFDQGQRTIDGKEPVSNENQVGWASELVG